MTEAPAHNDPRSAARAEPSPTEPSHHRSKRWHLPRAVHVGLVLLCVTLIGLCTWLASQQLLHPDPFRRVGNWDVGRSDWWAYPLERNAFKRTLVQGDLRAVFHLPGTEQVWVAGQGGLILHSDDGGRSWSQQNPRVENSPAQAAARAAETTTAESRFDWMAWLPSAHADAIKSDRVPAPQEQVQQSPVQQIRQQPVAPQLSVSPELAKELEAKAAYQAGQRADLKKAIANIGPNGKVVSLGKVANAPVSASVPASAPAATPASPVKSPDVDLWRSMLRAVFFLNVRQGWAVGDHGTILVTDDGGARWRRLPTPQGAGDVALRSIAFSPDGKQAWIVGDDGTFLHSNDAGSTWKPQSGITPTTEMLTSISMHADGRGHVVGLKGSAYSTQDGGKRWASINTVITDPKAGVLQALSVSQAAGRSWAVGVDGGIERYKEGEGTVSVHPLSQALTLRGVSAVGAEQRERVWAVGDDGIMLRSDDGGESWQSLPRQTDSTLRGVRFDPDGRRGWVVGDDGTLLATADGGATWVRQAGSDAVFGDVLFTGNGKQGWATGPYGLLLQTTDGGASWQPRVLTTQNSSIRPASYALVGRQTGSVRALAGTPDGRKVWAVGDAGTVFYTHDAGLHWVLAGNSTSADLHKVAFADDGLRGLAVGKGVILSTTNGGQTWLALPFFESGRSNGDRVIKLVPTDISGLALAADGSKAWAVGSRGAVYLSPNGGNMWTQQRVLAHEAPGDLVDVAAASGGQRAWAVGEHGTIASTQDGGGLWVTQTMTPAPLPLPAQGATAPASTDASAAAPFLRSVAVLGNGTTIWAAGDDALLQSRNSGATWEAQPVPGGTARLVRFSPGSQRGWLVGDGATLHTTTDGGTHWQPQALYERHWAPWYAAALILLSLSLAVLLGYVESGEQAPVDARAGSVAHILSSDQPVSDKSADRLGFASAVEALSAFIRNAHTEPRITLAVTGEWGSGKSSIMRMLQTDLQQAGFRTAWFNAWHHQQEGRQLAALFNVVRQQAVPQLWSQPFAWLRVRSRLIWGRGFFYQLVAVSMAVVLAVAAGDLFSVGYGQALDNLKLNVQHYVLQEHQTIVTGGTLDKLDPFRRQVAKSTVIAAVAAASSSPELLAAAGPAGSADANKNPPDDVIAQTADKPTAAGKPGPGTAKAAQDPCDNTALKLQLQKAVPVRPEVYCYMKRALLWEPSGQMLQCGDNRPVPPERHCVFARPQDLVATIKAHIQGDKLRPSEEQAILEAAETLPPPVVFPWLQRSLLGGLVGFIVLLFTKGWTIGSLQILQPIKNLLNIGSSGKGDTDKEPTGTVERCRAEFGVLTEALRGRLVIFIDDLDRCSADTVNGLMELTNYLVDVGQCFVVLGAAMDRVMLCIKPPVAPVDADAAREYAQAYLRKLVHVELPVPPTRDRLHELMDEPKLAPKPPHASWWSRTLEGFWRVVMVVDLKWLRGAVWLALIVGLTSLAFKIGARLQSGIEGQAQMIDVPNAVAESVVPRPDAPAPRVMPEVTEPEADQAERVKPSALLTPGAAARIEPRWWWAIGLLLPLSGLLLSWTRRYRARLTVVLGGVIRSHDSGYFMNALRLWKDVVIAHDPTPRHVKRFYNRARLFSAYEQRDGADRKLPATHDAHLVMMAALHHTGSSRLQDLRTGVLAVGDPRLDPDELARRLTSLLSDWPPALLQALRAHIAWFGSLPTAEQIERFEERLAGLRVS